MAIGNAISGPTCSLRTIAPVIAALRLGGHSIADVLSAAGVREEKLDDPDLRIPADRTLQAWEIGLAESQDAAFGLHAAEALRPDTSIRLTISGIFNDAILYL